MQFFADMRVQPGKRRGTILVQVHEKNALSLSDSILLGSTFKLHEINLKEGEVHNVAFELQAEKFVSYPRKSREPCLQGTKNNRFKIRG